jgi:hypothetical protein
MPCTTFTLDPTFGPVAEIGIAAPASFQPKGAAPPPITWIKAIADTGCGITSVFSGVAANAGLLVVGKTNVISTTHTMPANVYLGDLFIRGSYLGAPMIMPLPDRQFIELIQSHPNFDALLGMDVFRLGTLVVNGHAGVATFAW